jgi:hypothetical protein
MDIHIKIIEHKKQRYPTVGDWFFDDNGDLQIRVSRMNDGRHETLVAIHELIEAFLCDEANIDQTDVDKFDMEFEQKRVVGNEDEPGDSSKAPYYKQHQFATGIERILAAEVEVDWGDYGNEVGSL